MEKKYSGIGQIISFDQLHDILDSVPPKNGELAGIYKKSLAYDSFRTRMPKIIINIIDELEKYKEELICKYGADAKWDIKRVAGSLKRLRENMLDNKELEIFYDKEPDTNDWNEMLGRMPEEKCTWLTAYWLHADTYFYRRVASFFRRTNSLRNYDFFGKEKRSVLFKIATTMCAIVKSTRKFPCDELAFTQLLKLQTWANQCDLSITKEQPSIILFELLLDLDNKLLANQASEVWQCLLHAADRYPRIFVDIVCDNIGFELFSDLLMAEYIIDHKLALCVRFHVKAIPWFVSDVTKEDFLYTLRFLRQEKSPCLRCFGKKLTKYLRKGLFVLEPKQYYWTSPHEYFHMRTKKPCLYVRLAETALLIFKGDLNYRKLVGDYAYDPTEPFDKCLRSFHPTNICALRAIKSDVICGLHEDWDDFVFMKPNEKDWRYTGEYAVIHFSAKSFD